MAIDERGAADAPQVQTEDTPVEPWWLVGALGASLSGFAIAGIVGLALAILGVYALVWVALISLPLWIASLWWCVRPLTRRPTRTGSDRPRLRGNAATVATIVALVFVVGYLAFNATRVGQNVLVDRDPGSYTTTGKWIANEGTLEVDLDGSPFDNEPGIGTSSSAIYTMPDDVLQFQFAHFAPVILAIGENIGGDSLFFRTPLLLSALALVCLFALALRVLRRPWLAVLPVVALGVTLPQLWFSRGTYSETPMQVAALGGLWLLALARRSDRYGPMVLAGVLLGTMTATRIDAALLLVAPVVVLGVDLIAATPGDRVPRRRVFAFLLGSAIPIAVGIVDLNARSGYYDEHLGWERQSIWGVVLLGVAAMAVAALLRHRVGRLRSWLAEHRRGLGIAGGVSTVAAFAFLWGPRRFFSKPVGGKANSTMVALERQEGIVPALGVRKYAEQSVDWVAWYLGAPTVALGFIGGGLLAYELVRRRYRDALGLFVACVATALLYFARPSIFADQPWALRRYLPIVLPGLLVFAAFAIAWAWDWLAAKGLRRTAIVTTAILVLVVLAFPLRATWNVRDARSKAGFVVPILWACDQMQDDAAVLVVPANIGHLERTVPQTIRSWCGVPVAIASSAPNAAEVSALADRVRERGYRLYLMAAAGEPIVGLPGVTASLSPIVENENGLEQTLGRRPETLAKQRFLLVLGETGR